MSPERREELQRKAERIARELIEDTMHSDCTLKLVILDGKEAVVSCKHCQIIGPRDKVEVWG